MGTVASRFRFLFAGNKQQEIMMVGVDAVGKTTILYLLRDNHEIPTVPTIGFNIEECQIRKTKFKILDVGGQERIRHLWAPYSEKTDGLVYVFDISFPEKWPEAVEHLQKVYEEKRIPTLILMNKIDLLDGPKEIEERKKRILGMCNFNMDRNTVKVFCVSAKKSADDPDRAYMELAEAFSWLDTTIKKMSN